MSLIYAVCLRYSQTRGPAYALKKKLRQNKDNKLSNTERAEIHALKVLRNERYVISLIDLVKLPGEKAIVMELAVIDMATVARKKKHIMITDKEKKTIMYQFMRGVYAIHKNGLIHRDIKLSNLLIMANGILKVSDFGDSTPHASALKEKKLSPHVGSTYYKAPEVLFGDEQYNEKVDIWAMGCSMIELYTRRIYFEASNKTNRSQLEEIMKVVGYFNPREWPYLTTLKWYAHFHRLFGTLAIDNSHDIAMDITGEDEVASNYLCGLLAKYPFLRPNARYALRHRFMRGRGPNVKTLLARLNEPEKKPSSSSSSSDEEENEEGAEGPEGAEGEVEKFVKGAEGGGEEKTV